MRSDAPVPAANQPFAEQFCVTIISSLRDSTRFLQAIFCAKSQELQVAIGDTRGLALEVWSGVLPGRVWCDVAEHEPAPECCLSLTVI